jgi:hypothetical protein
MSKRQFPPAYAALAERSLAVLAADMRIYMLAMVETAENMPNRHTIKTPHDVIGLAVEGYFKKIYKQAKHKRLAQWAVNDLLEELGFTGEEGTNV